VLVVVLVVVTGVVVTGVVVLVIFVGGRVAVIHRRQLRAVRAAIVEFT
jgi:hypothetical protein